jgi:hypothetical protein
MGVPTLLARLCPRQRDLRLPHANVAPPQEPQES